MDYNYKKVFRHLLVREILFIVYRYDAASIP